MSIPLGRPLLFALLGVGLSCPPAFCSEPGAPAEAPLAADGADREVVYVYGSRLSYTAKASSAATRTPTVLEDIPQAMVVITRDVIDDQAMTGLGEVVRYIPGVTMAQGEGHRDAPVFRGNLTTADFFIDGVRDDLQYLRDLYNVERVEVLKGPSAIVFGRGAGGGALNRVSKVADGRSVAALEGSVSTHGAGRVAVDLGGGLSDTISGRLNVLLEEADSFRDEVSSSRNGFAPSLAWRSAQGSRLEIFAEAFSDDRTVDRGVPSRDGRPWSGSRSAFFGNPDLSSSTIDVASIRAVADHELSEAARIRAVLSYGDYSKAYSNVYAGGAVDGANQVRISAYTSSTDRQNALFQTDVILESTLAGLEHLVLVGLEGGRQESINRRINAASATFSLTDRGRLFAPSFSSPAAVDNNAALDLFAVLVQDQITLGGGFKAVLGARWDSFDLDFDDLRPGATGATRRDGFLSPKAALLWEPEAGVSAYAAWSRAFLPQSGEQFSSLTSATASLEPEEFDNTELGLRWYPLERLLFSAALYRLDRTNTTAPGALPGILVQTGSQRSEGLELSLQGEVSDRWDVIGAMAFQRSTITSSTSSAPAGRSAPLSPEFSASLWNRFEVSDRTEAALGVVHQGRQFASISNAVVLPAYTRLDAAFFFQLSETMELQLNLENLTGERYWPSAHNDFNITPGAPFNAKLSVAYAY